MILEKFKVYIINLKSDVGRKKSIIQQLNKQNIENYEIIDAINGNELSPQEIDSNTFKNKMGINPWNTKMSASQVGCALSHIKIYHEFIKSDYKYALILEDDAIFKNNFEDKIKKFILNSFKYKKQIILLSELKQFYKKPIIKFEKYELVDVTNAFFTHSYFINKDAAKSIINFNHPVKTIADNFVFFKIYCGVKITGINPFLIDQDKKNYQTTITIEKNEFNKIFLFKRTAYKLKMKIINFFIKLKSHNKDIK
jgi:glycosyl transferase family 25